jgi:hypothetical protein
LKKKYAFTLSFFPSKINNKIHFFLLKQQKEQRLIFLNQKEGAKRRRDEKTGFKMEGSDDVFLDESFYCFI